jgi:hypothetical protein
MMAEFFLIDDVGVASFANVVPSEGWRACGDLGDGCTAIMAVLTEALGDDGCAQQDENRQEDCHDDGEADEMFDVLEHECFPGPDLGRAQSRYGL